jgi:DNA-binding beta-propeller fold protein YncE
MKLNIDSAVIVACVLAAAVAGASTVRAAAPQYAIVATWKQGGEGGWDYLALAPGATRLFVTRGNRVDVVDTSNGHLTGSISGTSGVHGLAFAPELGRGFTSNGKSNSVTVFDLDSLKPVREIPVTGQKPDAILYDSGQRRVFTFNGATNNSTVIDAATLGVAASIALSGPPEFAVEADGSVFVNLETDPGQISAIDSKTLAVRSTWALAGCDSPSGLAVDALNHRLFSVCSNRVMAVTDSLSGKQVALVPIGAGPDAAVFDADRGLVFSSNGEDGTLTVVREVDRNHFTVLQSLPTQKTARTMVLDPRTHSIYLAGAQIDERATPAPGQHRKPMVPGSFSILVAAPVNAPTPPLEHH